MLIWECGRFLESLGAGRPLARCGSSVGRTVPQPPTSRQIANLEADVGRADSPGGLPLARRSGGAETATVEPEIGGCPSRHSLNADNCSFLVLQVWSLLLSVLILQCVTA